MVETLDSLEVIQRMSDKANGVIFCGASLVGKFGLSDTCRSGAAEAIEELKELGIRSAMLTGDSNAAAMLAYDQVQFQLLSFFIKLYIQLNSQFGSFLLQN